MKTSMTIRDKRRTLSAILLTLGAIDGQAGQVRIIEYSQDYPNGQFMGVEYWSGVTGQAWVTPDGSVFGGGLYIADGSNLDGYYWGDAQYYDDGSQGGGGFCDPGLCKEAE